MNHTGEQFVNNAKQRCSEISRDLSRTCMAGQDHREERTSSREIASLRDVYVDDLAILVDRPVHVPPHPCDLDIGFVNEPAVTDTVTAGSRGVDQQGCEALYPPVDRDVINIDPAFSKKFFYIAV